MNIQDIYNAYFTIMDMNMSEDNKDLQGYSEEQHISYLKDLLGTLRPITVQSVIDSTSYLDFPDTQEELDVVYDAILNLTPQEVVTLGKMIVQEVENIIEQLEGIVGDREAELETQRSLGPGRF